MCTRNDWAVPVPTRSTAESDVAPSQLRRAPPCASLLLLSVQPARSLSLPEMTGSRPGAKALVPAARPPHRPPTSNRRHRTATRSSGGMQWHRTYRWRSRHAGRACARLGGALSWCGSGSDEEGRRSSAAEAGSKSGGGCGQVEACVAQLAGAVRCPRPSLRCVEVQPACGLAPAPPPRPSSLRRRRRLRGLAGATSSRCGPRTAS